MRPIRLSVEGLHSFREKVVIDFKELSEMGVFGIFGPTGSGKSTLLDAITLALYGTVGRAGRGTQGILNHAEKSLSVSFEFSIGNGSKEQTYRVERRYRRNGEVNVINALSRLVDLSTPASQVVLAEKALEVTAKVEEILGLKADDFTRAVVLPQGKFAEFLHLKGKERIDMLQRLFSLGRYGTQLTNRLNQRFSQVDKDHLEVTSVQRGLGDASKEALDQEKIKWQESVQVERKAQTVLTNLQNEYKGAEQLRQWQEELAQLLKAIATHESNADAIERVRHVLSLSEKAEKVMPFVDALDGAITEESSRQTDKTDQERQVEQAKTDLQTAKQSLETAKEKKEDQEPGLIALQSKLEAAQQLEEQVESLSVQVESLQVDLNQKMRDSAAVRDHLDKLNQLRTELQTQRTETQQILDVNQVTIEYRRSVIAAKEKADVYMRKVNESKTLADELKTRQQELDLAKQEFAQQEAELGELNKKLVVLNEQLVELPSTEHEGELSSKHLKLIELLRPIQSLIDKEAALSQVTIDIRDLQQKAELVEEQVATEEKALKQAQEHTVSLRQNQTDLMLQDKQALAARLATDLCSGEACLVCGSVEHPNPAQSIVASSDFSQQLEESAIAIAEAEKIESEKRTHSARLIEMNVQIQTSMDGLQAKLLELSEQVSVLHHEVYEGLSKTGVELVGFDDDSTLFDGIQLRDWVNEQVDLLQKEKNQCRIWMENRIQFQSDIQTLQNQIYEQKVLVASSEQNVKATSSEAERSKATWETMYRDAVEAKNQLDQAVLALGVEDVLTAINDLTEKEERELEAKNQMKKIESELTVVESDLEKIRLQETELKVDISGVDSRLAEQKKHLREKQDTLFQTTSGRKVKDVLEEVTKSLTALRESVTVAQQVFEGKLQSKNEAEQLLSKSTALWQQAVTLLEQRKQEVAKKLQEHDFVTSGEVRDALLLPKEFQEKQQVVQTYQDQGKKLLSQRTEVEGKIQGRQLSDEQWQQIVQNLENVKNEVQVATAACGAAKERYEELQKKHIQWAELEEKRLELAAEVSRLTELKRVLRGNDFVEFLAQEQLEYVARQASERLKQLTRNRYALEVDPETGFVMRDDANGGVKRPVSSLSGGETFLTSLALALSLSTQIQLRGQYPLEFFFLDEGFGTLDPDLLEVVMSTLEQLHMEKMTIGVISHVPELRQRMNRRLIVEPAEASGRGSRVRLERA